MYCAWRTLLQNFLKVAFIYMQRSLNKKIRGHKSEPEANTEGKGIKFISWRSLDGMMGTRNWYWRACNNEVFIVNDTWS